MKYITEAELMFNYRQIPFESYQLHQTERLTPGARQYLLDHNVKIVNGQPNKTRRSFQHISETHSCTDEKEKLKLLKLQEKFLESALTLSKTEPIIAQELFRLTRLLSFTNQAEAMPMKETKKLDLEKELPLEPQKALLVVQLRQLYLEARLLSLEDTISKQIPLQEIIASLAQLITVF